MIRLQRLQKRLKVGKEGERRGRKRIPIDRPLSPSLSAEQGDADIPKMRRRIVDLLNRLVVTPPDNPVAVCVSGRSVCLPACLPACLPHSLTHWPYAVAVCFSIRREACNILSIGMSVFHR